MTNDQLLTEITQLQAALARALTDRGRLMVVATAYLSALRAGMPVLVGKGARSQAFNAHAEQTAAALRDLKAVVEELKGGG